MSYLRAVIVATAVAVFTPFSRGATVQCTTTFGSAPPLLTYDPERRVNSIEAVTRRILTGNPNSIVPGKTAGTYAAGSVTATPFFVSEDVLAQKFSTAASVTSTFDRSTIRFTGPKVINAVAKSGDTNPLVVLIPFTISSRQTGSPQSNTISSYTVTSNRFGPAYQRLVGSHRSSLGVLSGTGNLAAKGKSAAITQQNFIAAYFYADDIETVGLTKYVEVELTGTVTSRVTATAGYGEAELSIGYFDPGSLSAFTNTQSLTLSAQSDYVPLPFGADIPEPAALAWLPCLYIVLRGRRRAD
jgi:hypothetical protein